MRWIRGRGHDGGVAGADQREAQVAEAFFGAESDNYFAFGIEVHAPFFQVTGGDFAAEVQNAHRGAVAVVAGIAGGFGEFIDDDVGRGIGGIAHAHVDDVVAGASLLIHQLIQAREQIGWQALDALGDLDVERAIVVDRFGIFGGVFHVQCGIRRAEKSAGLIPNSRPEGTPGKTALEPGKAYHGGATAADVLITS